MNGDFEAHPVGTGDRRRRLEDAAEAVLRSAFAANYRLISPFKELAEALAQSRNGSRS